MFLLGSTVFTVASMACGLAPTAAFLIGFRVVQAAGSAALVPSSLALVMRAFPRERLPYAVAVWGAAGAAAGALGPTLGSIVVEALGWRWAFFINLPVGIFTVVSGIRTLRESSDSETRIPSFVGIGLVAAAAGLLSYGVVETGEEGWLSLQTLGVLGAGIVALVLFVAHQRRTTAPALNLELFRIRNFAWSNLAMLSFGIPFSAMFLGSILFLTQVWGWSILQAGFGVAPGPAIVAVAAPRVGRLAGRVGQRPIVVFGAILFALSGLFRVLMLDAEPNYLRDYFPSMLLSGLGVACCFPQLSSAVAQALPPNRSGTGGSVLQAVRQFAGTFGVALTIALVGAPASEIDALGAFDRVWWLIVAGGLVTALLALPLRTPATSPNPQPPSTIRVPGMAAPADHLGAPGEP
jgi:EmrB/QacA subfamily drug resistance transporter